MKALRTLVALLLIFLPVGCAAPGHPTVEIKSKPTVDAPISKRNSESVSTPVTSKKITQASKTPSTPDKTVVTKKIADNKVIVPSASTSAHAISSAPSISARSPSESTSLVPSVLTTKMPSLTPMQVASHQSFATSIITPSATSVPSPIPSSIASLKAASAVVPQEIAIAAPIAIQGTMTINFGSRRDSKNDDTYDVDLICGGSIRFKGKIIRRAREVSSLLGREKKPLELQYGIGLYFVNPKDTSDQKKVGQLNGPVTVSQDGAYNLSNLTITSMLGESASPLSGKFSGVIQGKAAEEKSIIGATYTRLFGTKKVSIKLQNIDPLRFENLRLSGGPIERYPESLVSGNLDYDYDTGNWLTSGITFHSTTGQNDTVTGSIKWLPDPKRATNGKGEYEFNIRFNEAGYAGASDEGAFFENTSDEEAFFAVDEKIPTLKGAIQYHDTFDGVDAEGEPRVLQSTIRYALEGTKVSQEQLVNFLKLWLLIVGPVNDE